MYRNRVDIVFGKRNFGTAIFWMPSRVGYRSICAIWLETSTPIAVAEIKTCWCNRNLRCHQPLLPAHHSHVMSYFPLDDETGLASRILNRADRTDSVPSPIPPPFHPTFSYIRDADEVCMEGSYDRPSLTVTQVQDRPGIY